jgi:starch-binding outer membrane protein, SusD/RagB family
LFQKKYTEALAAFNHVNDGTPYSLAAKYLDNFKEETEHNSESIFEVEFNALAGNSARWNSGVNDAGLNESCFRGQEYGCFDWYNVFPSVNLRNEFEAGDPRYYFSFYLPQSNYSSEDAAPTALPVKIARAGAPADTGHVLYPVFYNAGGRDTGSIPPVVQSDHSILPRVGWRKYENYYRYTSESSIGNGQSSGINMRIIRYADVLLMMAECEANLNHLPEAIALMNQVRGRADVAMPAYGTVAMDATYPVGTLAQFMVALEHERKVELCGEQVRWPDLVRWGRATAFIEELKAGSDLPVKEKAEIKFVAPKNLLWPIPQRELQSNPKMTQNTGY